MLSCLTLSIIRNVSRVKWSNPRKGEAPFPTPQCCSFWKRSIWSPSTMIRKCISPKLIVVARLEIELAYYNVVFQHGCLFITEIASKLCIRPIQKRYHISRAKNWVLILYYTQLWKADSITKKKGFITQIYLPRIFFITV